MTTYAVLATQGGPVAAIQSLLARLLRSGLVNGVVAPVVARTGLSLRPALITDPARLAQVDAFMPLLPLSGARLAALLSRPGPETDRGGAPEPRLAIVLRPCELRAVIELAKLRQIDLSRLVTIGVDCVGTYESSGPGAPADLAASRDAILAAARAGSPDAPAGVPYRHACSICVTPSAWKPDIGLHVIGVAPTAELLIEVTDEALLARLDLAPGADGRAHQAAVAGIVETRQARRQTALAVVAGQLAPVNGTPGLLTFLEGCQHCLNCTVACPICYCKSCLFRTDTFAHEPDDYVAWATRQGVLPLPADTVTFQLTRLAHVTLACVGCGLCTSACPAGLPVDALFQTVAGQTQALFAYVPGRDVNEPLPTATFRLDELATLGERARPLTAAARR